MEIIKYDNALKGKNSDKCKTLEYSFKDKEIDLGIATINGRYPDFGYGVNLVSKELIYMTCTPAWSVEQYKLIN